MTDSLFAAGQVHRFRDHVAAFIRPAVGRGATVYMEPGAARAMAAALIACADSVESIGFADSAFGSVEIAPDTAPPADNRALYRIVRHYAGDKSSKPRAGLMTLAEAQAHCRDPETSSKTARRVANIRHTATHGAWFDGYEMHPKFRGVA